MKKSLKKCLKKSLLKKFKNITNCWREGRGGRGGEGGEGGWRIVIPMPEAINEVDGRRQKMSLKPHTFFPKNKLISVMSNCSTNCGVTHTYLRVGTPFCPNFVNIYVVKD
jgi:hypothetical protein